MRRGAPRGSRGHGQGNRVHVHAADEVALAHRGARARKGLGLPDLRVQGRELGGQLEEPGVHRLGLDPERSKLALELRLLLHQDLD
eukprot:1549075-Alexandrium_andersonii.AAC.1